MTLLLLAPFSFPISPSTGGNWQHEPAALTAAAAFLLATSLLLLLLLTAALKLAPLHVATPTMIHADADSATLLAEMLGRPLGPGLISGFVQPASISQSPPPVPDSPVFMQGFMTVSKETGDQHAADVGAFPS